MSNNNAQVQLLNLAKIQNQLDEIVFENIDTGRNWERAQMLLRKLLEDSEQFFSNILERTNGKLPKANSYWALFMDLVAKLTYFTAYAEQQLGEEPSILASKYAAAVSFLPNCEHEGCVEFFEEVCESYKAVANEDLPKKSYSISEAIENYFNFLKASK